MKSIGVFLLCGLSLAAFTASVFPPPDQSLDEIVAKFNKYIHARSQEKLYLQLDKPLYAAGEDMWFSAYLMDASYHTASPTSKVVYVELFNSSKKLIQSLNLYSSDGMSHGDFHLPDSLPKGTYVLRAYTNYMRNTEEGYFFLKEVTVLDPYEKVAPDTVGNQIKKAMPTVDHIEFLPEGGNLLTGVQNRVAFKVTSRSGRGTDAEGEIVDENGTSITTFKSEHDGMGVFLITPKPNIRYSAKVRNANQSFSLPQVTDKGYMLRITDIGSFIKVVVRGNLDPSSEQPAVSIVAQARGIICFAAKGKLIRSELVTNIAKNKLPTGITQITLFDDAGIPQCERLVFVNHGSTLDFSFSGNKEQYTSRDKVDLTIDVKRKDGTPAKGNFSLSVYDESKIQNPEEYPMSIVSNLLLTSDLNGFIDEPGYYLKDTLPTTKHHVDLLMMTHGWRRFAWNTVLGDKLDTLPYTHEQGIRVSGKVMSSSRKPAPKSKIKIATSSGDVLVLTADSRGRFYDDGLLHYDSTSLVIETDNSKGRKTELGFVLDPLTTMTSLEFTPSPFQMIAAKTFLVQVEKRKALTRGVETKESSKMLNEVVVKSTRLQEDVRPIKIYGEADATVKMKDIPYLPTDVLQAISGRVAGVVVSGDAFTGQMVTIRGLASTAADGGPLFLLDGVPVDISIIRVIPVNDVESIDILKGPSTSIYGSRGSGGVIAIYTKRGFNADPSPVYGIHHVRYPGFSKAREFYSPRYDVADGRNDFQDIRSTLYWNPSVKTDSMGVAHVSFYTSDITSDYKLVVEGISVDGIPGTANFKISVH